jgi:hypothetical protein
LERLQGPLIGGLDNVIGEGWGVARISVRMTILDIVMIVREL